MADWKILLSHGSGGKSMHELIDRLLLKKLNNPILKELSDAARLDYNQPLAFTTDSFVVSPLKFPGGDIGKLAICGTVNDLVMLGSLPQYLSLGLIIEEGLDYSLLEEIVDSIAVNARKASVKIVTGDLKVVEKGACDKIFINTSGIGLIIRPKLSLKNISVGDKVIITGDIGRHGLAVLSKRKDLSFNFDIKSDCAALNNLILPLIKNSRLNIKFMRDPTRGGVATTLNEIALGSGLSIIIEEKNIPLNPKVKTASELLGIDPLYIANEGRALIVVSPQSVKSVLNLLRKHPLGKNAQEIGTIVQRPGAKVILNTIVGTQRIVDMLTGEQLPRIC